MRAPLVLLPFLVACFGYRPGAYRFIGADFPSGRTHAGCVDLAVGGHASSREDHPVVMYAFGNRCDHDATIDLRAARVWGITVDGEEHALLPRDPRREIVPKPLGGSWAGRAAIEYMTVERRVRPIFAEICVELAGVVPELTGFRHCFDPRVGGPS